MKTLLRFLALLLAFTAGTHAASVNSPLTAKERAQGYRDTVVLAQPRAAQLATVNAAEAAEGRVVRRRFDRLAGLRVIEVSADSDVAHTLASLRESGRYDFVEADLLRYARATPNDPSYSSQWSLHNTGQSGGTVGADLSAPTAWDTRTDASGVTVAVIDSGIRQTHTDLAANLWSLSTNAAVHGLNAITGSTNPEDDDGHGTHVSGIIAAVGNNGLGTAGVAWKAKVMALKFLDAEGSGSSADAIECIDYALANGAQVINASYGSGGYSAAEFQAIRKARDAGIVFVAAAGNDALNNDLTSDYPSGYALDNIVSVAATDRRDTLSSFSNYGSSVELAAPGSEILSTWHTSDTATSTASGTSMAAPHVTGAVALLRAQFPTDTYRQTINRLLRSATRLSALAGMTQTSGRLNLAAALTSTDNRPFNDDFADRAVLTGAHLRIRASNTGATAESGEPSPAGVTGATTSLWWSWTAPDSTQVSIDTTGSAYDTLLAVYTGTDVAALTAVVSNDNTSGTASRVVFEVVAGTTYHIQVAGKAAAAGYTGFTLGTIPANDAFAQAKLLTGLSVRELANNLSTSLETGEPNPTGRGSGHTLWYKWVAPQSGVFSFAAYATEIDTVAAVYTGTSVSALTLVAANNDNLGRSNSDALVSFTAAAGTTYYLQVDHTSSSSSTDGAALILTLTDSVWEFPALDEVTSPPAVDSAGNVYFGAGSEDGNDTRVYSLTSAGSLRWSYTTTSSETGIIGAAPALGADGTVYIGATDKKLYALNGGTGALKWSYTAGTALSSTAALASDGTVYFRDDTTLYALTSAGALKWTFTLNTAASGGTYASPVVGADGTIYLGTSGSVFYALTDTGTGATQKWSYTANGDIYTSAALAADGTVYFATLNGSVYALNADGTRQWIWSAPGAPAITSSPALGADGALYFAAYDKKLYALTATGVEKWSHTLGDEVRASSPALASDGTVYVGCYDSLLYAVKADGTLLRTYPTAKTIRSSPVIAGTRLYFGSADAKLHAFALPAGGLASAWPTFHANARRDGRRGTETIVLAASPASTFATVGSALTLSVTATSSGPLTYQWFKDGVALAGATAATYTVASVTADDAGSYTVVVTGSAGSVTSSAATVTVAAAGSGQLVNLSVLATADTGANTLIAGFVLSGSTATKDLLIRAVGPSLAEVGVTSGFQTDPALQLDTIAGTAPAAAFRTNDNWETNTSATAAILRDRFATLGAFDLVSGSKDAALLVPLASGVYTAAVNIAGAAGLVLTELYDASPATGARLVNISARGQVGGGSALIAGFVITGGSRTVLIRAVGGQLLTDQGVTGVLANPKLDLYQNGAVLQSNDTWTAGTMPTATLSALFTQLGAQPIATTSEDAALLVTLPAGVYSAQVDSADTSTGVALVEIYDVQ